MMKYIKNFRHKFMRVNTVYPWCMAVLKLGGGILTELINIYIIIQAESIEDVVKDFIALGIVAEIDNLMSLSIRESLVREVAESNITYPIWVNQIQDIRLIVKKWTEGKHSHFSMVQQSLGMMFFRTLDFIYVVLYFYFFPFLVVFLVNNYGIRDISADTEGGKLAKIDFTKFMNNKTFEAYYNKNALILSGK